MVKKGGTLRSDKCLRVEKASQESDLVLVLGSSLSGAFSDILTQRVADRSFRGLALGIVIINLQQTRMDGSAALRIFGETDSICQA